MMTAMPNVAAGLIAREWAVRADDRTVPGIMWTREGQTGRRPLLLIGHGGSQHKSIDKVVAIAGLFARRHGFAVAAIDGPIHGARRDAMLTGPALQAEFLTMWSANNRVDDMVADWKAAIDSLLVQPEVDPGAVAWFGVSMGTAYGLPLLAAEPRIKAAVLGMWGTSFANSERLEQDSPRVHCPVLFLQKWDDQLFTREGQITLFDKIGSERKWLKVSMGRHGLEEEQLDDARTFLAHELSSLKGS